MCKFYPLSANACWWLQWEPHTGRQNLYLQTLSRGEVVAGKKKLPPTWKPTHRFLQYLAFILAQCFWFGLSQIEAVITEGWKHCQMNVRVINLGKMKVQEGKNVLEEQGLFSSLLGEKSQAHVSASWEYACEKNVDVVSCHCFSCFLWKISVTVKAMQSKPLMAALLWNLGHLKAESMQSFPQELKSYFATLQLQQPCLYELGICFQTCHVMQFLANLWSWGLSTHQSLRLHLRLSV